jgi:hypothetical protein
MQRETYVEEYHFGESEVIHQIAIFDSIVCKLGVRCQCFVDAANKPN